MGVFGMLLGLYLVLSHLAGLKSFGIPYLSPFAAQNKKGYIGEKDSMIRFPLPFLTRRPVYARNGQEVRLKKRQKEGKHVYR